MIDTTWCCMAFSDAFDQEDGRVSLNPSCQVDNISNLASVLDQSQLNNYNVRRVMFCCPSIDMVQWFCLSAAGILA